MTTEGPAPTSGDRDTKGRGQMLAVGMVVLGVVTFAAMVGFVSLCDRV